MSASESINPGNSKKKKKKKGRGEGGRENERNLDFSSMYNITSA